MIPISLESTLVSILSSENSQDFAKEEIYNYKSIFLANIVSDDTNARFLPSKVISNLHAYQFTQRLITKQQLIKIYESNDKVLIGKSCIINCFKSGTYAWKKANKTIQSILELAENIAVAEIIQVPTIYPIDSDTYQILTGHRRFFAMIFNDGIDGAAHFKVYRSKPVLLKTKQFQENSSREELPQYGKLISFQDAQKEVDVLNRCKKRLGQKTLTVRETANLLGISMGAYDNYNVLTRYPAVVSAYENGFSEPLISIKKIILKLEKEYRKKYGIDKFSIDNKRDINKKLEEFFKSSNKRLQLDNTKKKRSGTTYRIGEIDSSYVMKTLLTQNVCDIDCGVDWNTIDWEEPEVLNDTLKTLISFLLEQEKNITSEK